MDIRRLEAFAKVYELGSFSKAGQELFLSQPTISAHIASLEQELGAPLFDRLGRSVLPTQAGTILYGHTREVFASLENARAEILLLKDAVAGVLEIGASTIPANYLLPRVLASFMARYPNVRVELKVGDTARIIDAVERGELLIGVVGAEIVSAEVSFKPILADDLIIIAPPGFAIGRKPAMAEIGGWPWIMRERGSGTRAAFEQSLAALGVDPAVLRTVITVESTQAVLQCVLAGMGVSVTSRLAAQAFLDRGEMTAVDVPGLTLSRQFYLASHEKRRLFPVVRRFMDFLTQPGVLPVS